MWPSSFLRIWSHLLKESLMEFFIFCAVHLLTLSTNGLPHLAVWKCYKILLFWTCMDHFEIIYRVHSIVISALIFIFAIDLLTSIFCRKEESVIGSLSSNFIIWCFYTYIAVSFIVKTLPRNYIFQFFLVITQISLKN